MAPYIDTLPPGVYEPELLSFLAGALPDFDQSMPILMEGCGLTLAQLVSLQWLGWELLLMCYLLSMYLLY